MKKLFLLGFFVFFFLVGTSFALKFDNSFLDCKSLEKLKGQFIGQKIPPQIPYQNELFNVYLKEKSFGSFQIEEGFLVEFSCNLKENATYDIKLRDEKIFETIDENKSLLKNFEEKLRNGDIKIEGTSFWKKFKLFFSRIVLKILGWF